MQGIIRCCCIVIACTLTPAAMMFGIAAVEVQAVIINAEELRQLAASA
jgi:hypothetical protein